MVKMPTYTHNAIFVNILIFQITSNNGKARKCQMPTYTHNAIFINILIFQITYHRKLGVMLFPHITMVKRDYARCQHIHTTLLLSIMLSFRLHTTESWGLCCFIIKQWLSEKTPDANICTQRYYYLYLCHRS